MIAFALFWLPFGSASFTVAVTHWFAEQVRPAGHVPVPVGTSTQSLQVNVPPTRSLIVPHSARSCSQFVPETRSYPGSHRCTYVSPRTFSGVQELSHGGNPHRL